MGCCLLQPPEGGGAALVVEIGESVIQNDGDGLFRWQHQLADGQPSGEVELIRSPGGQKLDVPVNGVPGGAGSEVKAPLVQGTYWIRGANRRKAQENGLAVGYDRLAVMAVSVFHLSHWRCDVTIDHYLLAV